MAVAVRQQLQRVASQFRESTSMKPGIWNPWSCYPRPRQTNWLMCIFHFLSPLIINNASITISDAGRSKLKQNWKLSIRREKNTLFVNMNLGLEKIFKAVNRCLHLIHTWTRMLTWPSEKRQRHQCFSSSQPGLLYVTLLAQIMPHA